MGINIEENIEEKMTSAGGNCLRFNDVEAFFMPYSVTNENNEPNRESPSFPDTWRMFGLLEQRGSAKILNKTSKKNDSISILKDESLFYGFS
ncbi:MAG: hypothetical protein JWQ35_2206 [Bacteriovoracaceae bacterium]|nr:hypothetical protein [Bacteriovoracaceae bacterium]